jgi:hypothetical protein
MLKIVFLMLLLACEPPFAGAGKPKPVDYTTTVQVVSSHAIRTCVTLLASVHCALVQHLNVVIDGKKYELEEDTGAGNYLLETGSYKAKVVEDKKPDPGLGTASEYHRRYELLFPDGVTRPYVVVGEDE